MVHLVMEAANCQMHGVAENDQPRLNPTNPVFAVCHYFGTQQIKNFRMEMKLFFLLKAKRCITSHNTLLFLKFTKHLTESSLILAFYTHGV